MIRLSLTTAALTLAGLATTASRPTPSTAADERAALFAVEEAGCLVCHRPDGLDASRVHTVGAPRLDDAGSRLTPGWLRRYLADPHGTRPGTSMPDLLASWSEDSRAEVVEALTHFLVSRGARMGAGGVAVRPADLEEGRQLYHELGCVQCHPPVEAAARLEFTAAELAADPSLARGRTVRDDGVPERQRVPLAGLTSKTDVAALAAFLMDPLHRRPSGRMPSLDLTRGEAEDVASYLLREQLTAAPREVPGLSREYYEDWFGDAVADFDALDPVVVDVAPRFVLGEHRPDHFGVRLSGRLRVDLPGAYTFWITSDDGSRLWIDGELAIANDGMHGMATQEATLELSAGGHAIVATMFEHQGGEGLVVEWAGPGIEREEIPAERLSHVGLALAPPSVAEFVLDPEKVDAGRRFFRMVGCASCHDVGDPELDERGPLQAPTLAELARSADAGCLSADARPGRPRYALDADAEDVLALLRAPDRLRAPGPGEEGLRETLARFRCVACHSRDGEGGPPAARLPYFFVLGGHDLGDEGRLPPELDEPGSKLRGETLARILSEGDPVRPYMATRMPRFGADNLAGLAETFVALDARPEDLTALSFDAGLVEDGRRLLGTGGLGCIQCHTLGEHDSLGIPAVDLATMSSRLTPGWFRRLLLDPIALNMNTRMPEFWVDGRSPVLDVLGGDPARQIEALWSTLSLGNAMPLPDGLVVPDAAFELVPTDRPILCGVFMEGVGPRVVVVGDPELLHYAFDVQRSRLAKVWFGRFFNARGTWEARAGRLELPPGDAGTEDDDVRDLPAGPPFARLPGGADAWPAVGELRARGRRLDADGRPTWRYSLGEIEIEESPRPRTGGEGGPALVRAFVLRASEPVDDLWFQGWRGRRRVVFEPLGEGYQARFEEVIPW